MKREERYLMERLALVLDAAIPALEKAAETEKRREAGKSLR